MEKEIKKTVKILFVCLGNICRSPAAEGVFKHMLRQRGITGRFEVDSAGTYSGHAGELPDPRMRSHAARRGYLLEHRSRPVRPDDFEKFDLILGMDDYNIDTLRSMADSPEEAAKVKRVTDYCRHYPVDCIPDPYYGGADGFENVLNIFESAREKELVFVHKTVYDGEIHPSDELDGGRFWRTEEIKENIGKGIFTPNFEQEIGRIIQL